MHIGLRNRRLLQSTNKKDDKSSQTYKYGGGGGEGGGRGGGVFPPPICFCLKLFVLEPIYPKFGNFSQNLIQNQANNKNVQNFRDVISPYLVSGSGKFDINAHNF